VKIAVVGGGWAGLAAAVTLQDAGASVTVFEASYTPGGRARRVDHSAYDALIDNGQHILLGAYRETLALMRRLGCAPELLLHRQSLCLATLDGDLRVKASTPLPAPFHAVAALLCAHGLSWSHKRAVLRFLHALTPPPPPDWSVAKLLFFHRQPRELVRRLWEPLCLAALNTPPLQASAMLFVRVLSDSLTARSREASDLYIPRRDLSSLWPDAAAQRLGMRYGHTVRQIRLDGGVAEIDGERFDAAVLATPPPTTARLLAPMLGESSDLVRTLRTFAYLPIATLYLRLVAPWRLPEPMMMLRQNKRRGHEGQWVFDRAALADKRHEGELAVVVSAAKQLISCDRQQIAVLLAEQVREQAQHHFAKLPAMPPVAVAELLIDKRATFAAVPGLARPSASTPWPSLVLAGDWTDTGYPGVLEGAVRSGLSAARLLMQKKGDAPPD